MDLMLVVMRGLERGGDLDDQKVTEVFLREVRGWAYLTKYVSILN